LFSSFSHVKQHNTQNTLMQCIYKLKYIFSTEHSEMDEHTSSA